MGVLGARHTGGGDSAVSTYLNVDGSARECLLQVTLQIVLGKPIAVDHLDNHCRSEANGRLNIARSELV